MNDKEYKEFQNRIFERDKEIFQALAGIDDVFNDVKDDIKDYLNEKTFTVYLDDIELSEPNEFKIEDNMRVKIEDDYHIDNIYITINNDNLLIRTDYLEIRKANGTLEDNENAEYVVKFFNKKCLLTVPVYSYVFDSVPDSVYVNLYVSEEWQKRLYDFIK